MRQVGPLSLPGRGPRRSDLEWPIRAPARHHQSASPRATAAAVHCSNKCRQKYVCTLLGTLSLGCNFDKYRSYRSYPPASQADPAVPVFVLLFGTRFLCFALRISNATAAAAIPVAPGQGECHKRLLAKFNCFKCCEFPVQQLPIFHSLAPQYGTI